MSVPPVGTRNWPGSPAPSAATPPLEGTLPSGFPLRSLHRSRVNGDPLGGLVARPPNPLK